jgi:hypothetical protein
LADIPGQRIAVIGIGGGSDGIQAALLANLLEVSGKTCPCVISVRTAKTGSQGSAGKIGEQRTVENHGGEISEGVYAITSNTTGSGRFLENIPATQRDVFLVIDRQDGTVHSQIQDVIQHVSGVDTIIAVDTGGDALYSVAGQDQAKATPDQDLRILQALRKVPILTLTCEIACGVDSPENAEEVLRSAGASYYKPNVSEIRQIMETYREWEMDGTNPKRFGKTPLAWQSALQEKHGYTCLPLPTKVVTDRANPWNPFVYVDGQTSPTHEGSMSGIFVMSLAGHLTAIGAEECPTS